MKRFFERVFKIVIALVLLPAVYTAGVVLWNAVEGAPFFVGGAAYLAQGVVAYLFVHTLLWEPTWLYILGHELTHALWGLLFFARITGFKVSRSGGSVTLSKSNFLIALGPYLTPLYTLLVCLAFLFVRMTGYAFVFIKGFLILVGFTWAMHLVMTVKFIRMDQPDLMHTGTFFSLALIALVNVIILAAILSVAVPGMEFMPYIKTTALESRQAYQAIFTQLFL